MDFISNTEEQQQEMQRALGIDDIQQLFRELPADLLVEAPKVNDGLSEWEGMALMRHLGKKNSAQGYECYLGAGAYEHHVPVLAGAITSKSEFLTAYTPYQAEASQGMLQAIFEFQSAVAALTGLDVANASVYDGASACAEACLMALRSKKGRRRILVGESLHPHYRAVIDQYLDVADIVTVPMKEGAIQAADVAALIDDQTAAVLLSYPSFFGTVDDLESCFEVASNSGALSIVCANPLCFGLIRSAKEIGADIAVGDLQPLGLPLAFGGPYVGYMACSKALTRQLPGRLVGETIDTDGQRGFVLALQAREQHIRREKATSNICSNQNLAAISSLVTMLWYGPKGLEKLAKTNFQRAAYLQEKLCNLKGVEPLNDASFFNEFAIRLPLPADKVIKEMEKEGILAGIDLGNFYPEYSNCLLVAVTETKNRRSLDRYVACLEKLI